MASCPWICFDNRLIFKTDTASRDWFSITPVAVFDSDQLAAARQHIGFGISFPYYLIAASHGSHGRRTKREQGKDEVMR